MPNPIQDRVAAALAVLAKPDKVHDLAVDDAGHVSFTFHLTREDPATLVRDARKAVQAVAGVADVKINVVDAGGGRQTGGQGAASSPVPPPPSPSEMPHLGRVLAISSGKGGVGKSTVSVEPRRRARARRARASA